MKLHRWLPGTMAGLVASGCLIGAAPLLVALVMAGTALERLTEHGERLVSEGVTVARLGAELRDRITALERSARQYVVLGDPALLDVFYSRMLDIEISLRRMENETPIGAVSENILRTRQGLAEAARAWTSGLQNAEDLTAALERVTALHAEAEAITQSGERAMDQQVGDLRHASDIARRVMLFSALALIPLTALLAFGMSLAVTRPLRSLGRSIAALGHSRYSEPIVIEYPREMRRLGERLEWLRQRLAKLESDKDRFLRHLSHELKTPLASLYEGTELLREGALGPISRRQSEVMQILRDSVGELASLITNLLAYAEWREERWKAGFEWFDAEPMVNEMVSSHRLPILRRKLNMELQLHSGRLFGQRTRLRAALDNLLTNAIKHAPHGSSIEVRVGGQAHQCELSVRDYGRGVPEAEKGRIFEPFVRGTEAEETGIRGTGIGLSIVKDTVAAHGGTVEVQDAHPGALFRLSWPCPSPVEGGS